MRVFDIIYFFYNSMIEESGMNLILINEQVVGVFEKKN